MNKNKLLLILIVLLIGVTVFSYHMSQEESINEDDREFLSEEIGGQVQKEEEIKQEPIVSTATILAAGDVMFHKPQIIGAYDSKSGTYDFNDCFQYVKKYIEKADLSLVNFETVTAGSDRGFHGYPNFNSPVESLEALKNSGFDILSTANNHSLDQGKVGLVNTIEALKKYGFKNIGTFNEPGDKILIEKINDINIGLLSYTYGCNGMEYTLTEEELNNMINLIDEERIKTDIEKAVEMGSDLVVVFIHWGNEYQREPSEEQLELGRKMVEWGANIVFGSHPHVIQKSEIIEHNGKDNFIIYSLGNFISNQRRETINNKYTEDGIMVTVEVEKDFSKDETIIKNITYTPTWVYKYSKDGVAKYEIIPIDESNMEQIDDAIHGKVKESYENTMSLMGQ
ncbi:CapA family protein [Anaerosalibacter sp. Marseille-P3206]|uniref:CapA family protein n=1 Tax=Anaerosalibacter sp. Marseille-P3206 TaxID=1871005 RepID=UPI000984D4F2|nr:CapA family protein [Anaerosalibacter sp. Marseille-P3206]